ncbi:hypothetical protein, partial [Klebsiella pneumoniae]|uniref:hypothetical protein n=1 Tax=Klebsiella pneumoniae TaxID=573 RepID=UPI001C9A3C38
MFCHIFIPLLILCQEDTIWIRIRCRSGIKFSCYLRTVKPLAGDIFLKYSELHNGNRFACFE